jgi:hypothetical protein
LVPVERIELPTFGLQNRCSTAELNRQLSENTDKLTHTPKSSHCLRISVHNADDLTHWSLARNDRSRKSNDLA